MMVCCSQSVRKILLISNSVPAILGLSINCVSGDAVGFLRSSNQRKIVSPGSRSCG